MDSAVHSSNARLYKVSIKTEKEPAADIAVIAAEPV